MSTATRRVDLANAALASAQRRHAIWSRLADGLTHAVLIVGAVAMLGPFAWMVSTSLKLPGAVFAFPPEWIPNPAVWGNYWETWNSAPFGWYLFNTVFVSVTVTFLELLTSSLAGYSFARLRYPGRDKIFLLYLGTLMIPGQVTIIPNFVLMKYLGWTDTYLALIIPVAFTAFGTFLLRQFFLTIPHELEEAAKIDGASYPRIFATIVLPLSGPALATLSVFAFMSQWNNFLWPLIVTNSNTMRTFTVGLRFFVDEYNTKYHLLMAGSVMSIIPIILVFIFFQRYFVSSIKMTGMGGS
jgi:multiple sugar transport system permease protein